ncbi:MAG: UDP-N-acetylmuramoylalanyl-D-glutamyl-2,6-diaminopimelate--D-alanyl-D-alanine ligase [Hyphomicrobiales bacterium]|nr:UDP-N-acetylmuramoylalanyl-D-glutamyl-2,6-diaminopimelate--D-alanyl-D-alanine ligase [Hyphomicrobiales bacterium]MCP5371208.1 UDP-N-acetylmuramoylalanyl-D-glutamyl-2,6-diaminopimelate--D-alanyl-D-alanine ligase [Hyphomicrobiales bacterium]
MTPVTGAPLWTAEEAAAATGGTATGVWVAAGMSIDSRTLEPGDLFVALEGPNHDGHDYVAAALQLGAAAALVARRPDGLAADAPLLIVPDTLQALRDLARAARARSRARVIAVTGSVGKTGTKEALRTVLAAQDRTHANVGSLNNHWGLPLSLARLPEDAAYAVFEMGMNHPGEIVPLSRLARPHIALVTTVAAVHSAHFTSVEQIADAKAEVFAGIEPGGAAVLNRDNPFFDRLRAAGRARGIACFTGFGESADADVRLVRAVADAAGSDVTARLGDTTLDYRVNIPGRHWVINSLAVLATAGAAGADVAAAARAMALVAAPRGRGNRHRVEIDGGAFDLIDESYNASPTSMAAALAVLGDSQVGDGGRRIAVLGDMLELGDAAAQRHAELLAPVAAAGIDLVYTAGPAMAHLWDRLPRGLRGGHAVDSAALAPLVAAAVGAGDVVMVKGSAGSRTGLVVRALLALAVDAEPAPRAANGG